VGLLCAATLLIAGCSRRVASPDLVTVEHEISPAPARVGITTFTFKLADAGGKPVAGARVAVEADMSHAGMSPVFADAKEEQPGRYQARLNFQMAGDWTILLHVSLPGGKKLERQIEVRGVRPN
jgi:YtkA-like protein